MPPTLEDIQNDIHELDKDRSAEIAELSVTVDKLYEEIGKKGGPDTATNEKIASLEEKIRLFDEERSELKGKMELMEKFAGRGGVLGSDMPTSEMRTIGKAFSESEALTSYVKRGSSGISDREEVDFSITGRQMQRKAGTLTSADTGWGAMGGLIQPFELGEVIEDPQRTFFVRDLLRIIPVDSDAVHYAEETGFAPLFTELTANASAAATTITVESTSGMFVGQSLLVNNTTTATISAINTTTNVVTITPAVPTGGWTAGMSVVSYQLAMIPHGGQKPQGSMRFADHTLPIGTIADWIAVHRQTLQDARQLSAMIDSRLRYGLALAEEDQLLFGNGTSPNLTGIMINANVQDHGFKPVDDNEIDHIRRSITKAEIAMYPVNGVVLHPKNWENIELLKDSEERYIYLNIGQGNERRLFAIPIVATTVMPINRFLSGAFALGAYLFDREEANVRVSESHDRYFTQNMVAVLAEQREGLGVVRPEAFIKGSFAES